MATYDVQSIELSVSAGDAFDFIADPQQLPRWTSAFARVEGRRALMRTPNGEVQVGLRVEARKSSGTIDWFMTFPDGSLAVAYSRVHRLQPDRCVYSFVLTPPPVTLEALEGAMQELSRTLAEELARLKELLAADAR